ncbi:hypothetical protein MIR68_007393 [Amoeboaphelidium protococcarum]|nr:hypothetical protein MIR68_007393 [Amoeboaphelidium protococcarum]
MNNSKWKLEQPLVLHHTKDWLADAGQQISPPMIKDPSVMKARLKQYKLPDSPITSNRKGHQNSNPQLQDQAEIEPIDPLKMINVQQIAPQTQAATSKRRVASRTTTDLLESLKQRRLERKEAVANDIKQIKDKYVELFNPADELLLSEESKDNVNSIDRVIDNAKKSVRRLSAYIAKDDDEVSKLREAKADLIFMISNLNIKEA